MKHTLQSLKKLAQSPRGGQEIREIVADLVGWKNLHWYEDNAGPPIFTGVPPPHFIETYRKEKTHGGSPAFYPTDLNAIQAEIEAFITLENAHVFMNFLRRIAGRNNGGYPGSFACVISTAIQRCIAFILTMQGT